MDRRVTIALLTFMSIAGVNYAQAQSQCASIKIENAVISLPFEGAKTAAGYMRVTATNGTERLMSAQVEGIMTQLHETISEDGVNRMEHRHAVELAEGQTSFQPGGLHIMLMGLRPGQLAIGDKADVVLTFECNDVAIEAFTVVRTADIDPSDFAAVAPISVTEPEY